MKQLITALALTLAAAGVFAADAAASKPLSASQQKMADCSAANKGKKGDEYKSAQKACLAGAPAAASAPLTQLTAESRMRFDKAFIQVLVRRLHAAHETLAHPRRVL